MLFRYSLGDDITAIMNVNGILNMYVKLWFKQIDTIIFFHVSS